MKNVLIGMEIVMYGIRAPILGMQIICLFGKLFFPWLPLHIVFLPAIIIGIHDILYHLVIYILSVPEILKSLKKKKESKQSENQNCRCNMGSIPTCAINPYAETNLRLCSNMDDEGRCMEVTDNKLNMCNGLYFWCCPLYTAIGEDEKNE